MKKSGNSTRLSSTIAPLAVLAVGLCASAGLYQFTAHSAQERQQIYFDFRAREAVGRIKSRMATYQQVLRGTAGFFDVHELVSREDFRKYAERQALDQYLPGTQGIGFAQAISPDSLASYIDAVRAEGFPSFSVQPAGERDLYSSIVYLEPFSGRNLRAFGFDMYAEPVRRAAMQRSADTGEMALSGAVRLVQESGVQEQSGFLIYQAIYARDKPAVTVQERRAHLRGWVYAPFRMTDFLRGLLGEQERDLVIDIFDGEQMLPAALAHSGSAGRQDIRPGFESVRQLRMMGRAWTIRIQASTSLLERVDSRLPVAIAIAGVLLSGLLAGLVFLLVSGRSRAEAAARAMTEDLSLERARLSAILEGTRVGTWEWNVQTGETVLNEEWARIVGCRLEELGPVSIVTWASFTHPDDLQKSDKLLKEHFAGETPFYECEARMRHKDGHWIWVLDRGKVGKWDEAGKPLIMYGTHQDITRGKLELETYHHGAHHDVLTDLPNRVLLTDRISQALALAKREKTQVALLFMDLDGFKSVNDNHGHDAGDVVLQHVARLLLHSMRASDTLARVGGDEFVALLQDIGDEQEALKMANLFISKVRHPIALPNGSEAQISMSVGIAIYPQHGVNGEVLSEHADQAMYQVKRGSKNAAVVYQSTGSA